MTWPARPWVSSAELAAIAGRNHRTILREIERGHLRAERAGGAPSPWIIATTEAQRWVAAYQPERTPRR